MFQPTSYSQVHQYCNWPDSGTGALVLNSYNTLVGMPVPWPQWYRRSPDSGLGYLWGFPWCPGMQMKYQQPDRPSPCTAGATEGRMSTGRSAGSACPACPR